MPCFLLIGTGLCFSFFFFSLFFLVVSTSLTVHLPYSYDRESTHYVFFYFFIYFFFYMQQYKSTVVVGVVPRAG